MLLKNQEPRPEWVPARPPLWSSKIMDTSAPRLHVVTENNVVIESFETRKMAREFCDNYGKFYRTVAKVKTLTHQASLGDLV
jgi:hypothetical protein